MMTTHIQHIYNFGVILLEMQSGVAKFFKASTGNNETDAGKARLKLVMELQDCYNGLLSIDTENLQLKKHIQVQLDEITNQRDIIVKLKRELDIVTKTLNELNNSG